MRDYDLIAVIEGTHITPPMPDLQMVAQGGLTAVLTSAPRPALRLPKSQRQTLIDAAKRLSWQEACMQLGTLVPAQQDSPLSPDRARDFLIANQPQLLRLLQRFQGLVQVQVTVAWDETGVLARFRDTPELAPIFAAASVQPAALGAAVQDLARRLSQEMGERLANVSAETVLLPQTPSTLWNGAMLVQLAQIDQLYAAVEAIDAIWPEGLQIRQIGPAPVGSFATLALQRVTAREIQTALAAFDLTSLADIDLLAARRRDRLMATADPSLRHQADLLTAAARLPVNSGLVLAQIWAEGHSNDLLREVA